MDRRGLLRKIQELPEDRVDVGFIRTLKEILMELARQLEEKRKS